MIKLGKVSEETRAEKQIGPDEVVAPFLPQFPA